MKCAYVLAEANPFHSSLLCHPMGYVCFYVSITSELLVLVYVNAYLLVCICFHMDAVGTCMHCHYQLKSMPQELPVLLCLFMCGCVYDCVWFQRIYVYMPCPCLCLFLLCICVCISARVIVFLHAILARVGGVRIYAFLIYVLDHV